MKVFGRIQTTREVRRAESGSRTSTLAFIVVALLAFIPASSPFQPSLRKASARSGTFFQPAYLKHSSPLSATGSSSPSGESSPGNLVGKWEELHGNYFLRPPIEGGAPRAVIHFLGGALVGAGPHISYRYLLERLAANGYLVVATPYNLSFDYLAVCDDVISRFEQIAPLLARTYGPVPVIGVGHSCGAVLQLLISSLFPDTPRAANAFISYNNKPVEGAIPVFEEVFVPFFTYVAARNETRASGSEIISVGLELAKVATSGKLPSDELLSKAARLMAPPGFEEIAREKAKVNIPTSLRDAYSTLVAPSTTALSNAGLAPLIAEVLDALQQIPLLIDEVADGARDFIPPPEQVRTAARRSYRARRTLIIKYTEDPIDESEEIEELLKAASQVIRMKRPMIEIDVQRRDLPGGHAAPLLAPPLDLATRAETILGVEAAKQQLMYTQADQTVDELVRWLDESNL
jgi:hypothetical protein